MIEEINSTEEIENLYKEGTNAPYTKVENGHGYLGVLIREKSSGKIQCHICGDFFNSLSYHARKHKYSSSQYKTIFGFPKYFPLCSVKLSEQRRNSLLERIRLKKISPYKKGHKTNTKALKNWYKTKKRPYLSTQNKKNSCNEQLFRRYMLLSDELGKTVSERDLKKHDLSLRSVILKRHGTFGNFKKTHKLGEPRQQAIALEKDKALNQLVRFCETNKRIPRTRDFYLHNNGNYSYQTILKHFGSWNRALSMAGLIQKEEDSFYEGVPKKWNTKEMSPFKNIA